MTFEELLLSLSTGKMPHVHVEDIPRPATSNTGRVTVIKDNGRHKGIGVTFPGLNNDLFYWAEAQTDKRSKYMADLKLLP